MALDLRRLGPEEVIEWIDLMDDLEQVELSNEEDVLVWALENSGKFSNKSLYRLMTSSGEIDLRMKQL